MRQRRSSQTFARPAKRGPGFFCVPKAPSIMESANDRKRISFVEKRPKPGSTASRIECSAQLAGGSDHVR